MGRATTLQQTAHLKYIRKTHIYGVILAEGDDEHPGLWTLHINCDKVQNARMSVTKGEQQGFEKIIDVAVNFDTGDIRGKLFGVWEKVKVEEDPNLIEELKSFGIVSAFIDRENQKPPPLTHLKQ